MAIAIQQDEGSETGTARTLVSVVGNLMTLSGTITVLIGDIVRVVGTTAPNIDGAYTSLTAGTVAAINVSPTPAASAAQGSPVNIRRLNRTNTLYTALLAAAFSTTGGVNFITGGGAQNFVTSGVRRGDRVIIAGGGQNNGACYVRAVLSPTLIAIDTIGGAAWATAAITTETVAVRSGLHRVITLDEAALDSAEILASATVVFAGGVAGNPTLLERVNVLTATVGQERYLTIYHGLSRILLTQSTSSTSTVFTMKDEAILPGKLPATGTGIVNYRIDVTTPSGLSHIVFGSNKGSTNASSFGEGAYVLGFSSLGSTATLKVSAFGSAIDAGDGVAGFNFGAGDVVGVSFKGVFAGGSGVMRALSLSDKAGAAFFPVLGFDDSDNVVIGFSTAAALFTAATFGGIFIGDQPQLTPPLLLLAAAITVNADDPQEDYDIDAFFVNAASTPTGQKRYTFNPRFVKASPTGAAADPILGLIVRVYSINETTEAEVEASGSPFTTGADGRIPGGGFKFVRQSLVGFLPTTKTAFTTRIIARGPGYRTLNRKFQLRAPFDGDIGVQLLADNLENEVSAL